MHPLRTSKAGEKKRESWEDIRQNVAPIMGEGMEALLYVLYIHSRNQTRILWESPIQAIASCLMDFSAKTAEETTTMVEH